MFNMHPQNLTLGDLINFLTHSYPEDVYIREMCERVDSLQESEDELRSEIDYLRDQLTDKEEQDA